MPGAATKPQDGTHLFDYIRVVLKRLWLILGVFVVVVGVVGFATIRATPMYRATAVVNIKQPGVLPGGLDPSELLRSVSNSQVFMNTQYELLRNRATIVRMIERGGLLNWSEFRGMSASDIARSIAGNIEVSPRKNTTLVAVSVVDPRKTVVHRVANELVETFKEIQTRRQKSSMEQTIGLLEGKVLHYADRAGIRETAINRLFEENDTDRDTFQQKLGFAWSRIQTKQRLIDDTEIELAKLRPFYEEVATALQTGDGNGEALVALYDDPRVLRDPQIVSISEEIISLHRTLMTYLDDDLGPEEPRVVAIQRAIGNKEAQLDRAQRTFLLVYYRDYESLLQTKSIYEEQLAADEEEFRLLSRLQHRFDELNAEVARYDAEAERYKVVWEKLLGSQNDEYEPVMIEERAEQPFAPFKPDKQLNLILGAIFGLLGGFALAFFLEYMDDTIKTKEELERITDVPLLGVIPAISGRRTEVTRRDLFAYSQPKSTISEAFRGVRTAISYSSKDKEKMVYLITSAGPKEGKTTIAINIATVLAYSGSRTLLVDADLRRPRIHKSFDVPNSAGLTNLIIGDTPVHTLTQRTKVDRLDVLTSGPIPPNPSELLGKERMVTLIEELKQHYDRILIDTPPIGAVTDAAVLGRLVDQVILVVHAGRTRKKLVERGLEQLGQIGVKVSGIVLNNLRIGQKRYYPGYYHYYYYYSSYYGADKEDKGRARDKG